MCFKKHESKKKYLKKDLATDFSVSIINVLFIHYFERKPIHDFSIIFRCAPSISCTSQTINETNTATCDDIDTRSGIGMLCCLEADIVEKKECSSLQGRK